MENLKDRIQQIISVQLEFATDEIEREIENYGEIKDFGSLEDMLSITTQKLTKIYLDHISEEAKLHFRAKELVLALNKKYHVEISSFFSLYDFYHEHFHVLDYEERQKVMNLLDQFETL